MKETFRKRRELLHSALLEVPGQFMYATSSDSTDTDKISEFLDDSVKGLVIFSLTRFLLFGST